MDILILRHTCMYPYLYIIDVGTKSWISYYDGGRLRITTAKGRVMYTCRKAASVEDIVSMKRRSHREGHNCPVPLNFQTSIEFWSSGECYS